MTSSEIEIRALERPDDLAAVVALYESVFLLGPGDGSLNPRLLVGIARNGGNVLGAFSDGELVGFTLAFLGRDEQGSLYQYSQLATVALDRQGQGIGRRLKLAQREATLAMGLHEIRWSFDPFTIRNSHFNLRVLGALGVGLIRDMYGEHGHGLDAPTSTHRLIASWPLDVEDHSLPPGFDELMARAREMNRDDVTLERVLGDAVTLSVPSKAHGRDADAAACRENVITAMEGLFDEGLVALSCGGDERSATYLFGPRALRGEVA